VRTLQDDLPLAATALGRRGCRRRHGRRLQRAARRGTVRHSRFCSGASRCRSYCPLCSRA
jgi:hypothetical protein